MSFPPLHIIAGQVEFPLWFLIMMGLFMIVFVGVSGTLLFAPPIILALRLRAIKPQSSRGILWFLGAVNCVLAIILVYGAIINLQRSVAFLTGFDFTMQLAVIIDIIALFYFLAARTKS